MKWDPPHSIMKLIDTHTHLYLNEFENDITDVIERATNEGVEKFYLPAIDSPKLKICWHNIY